MYAKSAARRRLRVVDPSLPMLTDSDGHIELSRKKNNTSHPCHRSPVDTNPCSFTTELRSDTTRSVHHQSRVSQALRVRPRGFRCRTLTHTLDLGFENTTLYHQALPVLPLTLVPSRILARCPSATPQTAARLARTFKACRLAASVSSAPSPTGDVA